jgi:hypothetical protein
VVNTDKVTGTGTKGSSNYQSVVHLPNASQTDGRITLSLPCDQISIFARSVETSAPLVGMSLYAIALVGVLPPPSPVEPASRDAFGKTSTEAFVSFPLGLLGTNHAGYASFDLTVLRRTETINAYIGRQIELGLDAAYTQPAETIGLRKLWVFPFADPALMIDALEKGDIGPQFIALRISLNAAQLAQRQMDRPMVAMQNPNILDWRLSPESFTLSGSVLVGEDGCETLLPSNLSAQLFRFREVARRTGIRVNTDQPPNSDADIPPTEIRGGYVFEYTTEWFSVGHSLGQLIYSLPLAPGEVVKLAFIDWSRSDSASRTEDTGFSESLKHDQVRDRSLNETVEAALTEMQHGHSFMAGAAASAGGSIGIVSAGLTGAIGGSTSTSEGTRTLTGKTTQNISDAFHQASTAIRELRSTVIVQSTQSEKTDLKTRVVANYNHSHALTMLYYEVLRHYRVVTRLASEPRRALLIKYSSNQFQSAEDILTQRKLLESVILDERMLPCFDAVDHFYALLQEPAVASEDQTQTEFTFFDFGFDVGSGSDKDTTLTVDLLDSNLAKINSLNNPGGGGNRLDVAGSFADTNTTYNLAGVPASPPSVKWKDIFAIRFGITPFGNNMHLDLKAIRVAGKTASGQSTTILNWTDYRVFSQSENYVRPIIQPGVPKPQPDAATKLLDAKARLTGAERVSLERLLLHLQSNVSYYNRALWLSEDPNARAARFDSVSINNIPLLDLIENRALEVSGTFVAFPLNARDDDSNDPIQIAVNRMFDGNNLADKDSFIEQLLTLPTRGVFGEAKLGHCNSSEIIDNTRFWDWQKSQIEFAPPDIQPLNSNSRAQTPTGLTPTPFPQSTVNIVTPGALPDPTGLAGALKVLGTPGIFRDQSGLQETGTLLGKLSDNATALASQALQGQNRKSLMDDIQGSNLPDAQKTDLIGKLLTGQVQQQNTPTTKPTSTPTNIPNTASGTGAGSGGTVPSRTLSADELNQRADTLKGLVGYAQPAVLKDSADALAKQASLLAFSVSDPSAEGGAGDLSTGLPQFTTFYKKYLDTHYPNVYPSEDSSYTKLRQSYDLKAKGKAFTQSAEDWDPMAGFRANEQRIRELYGYYRDTFNANPDKFLWAGLARMAGGAVLSGLLSRPGADPAFLTNMMVLIGKQIFGDLAWQHEAFLDDPKKSIALAREHDTRYPVQAKYEDAWTMIASADPNSIAEGNKKLLENEQFAIIQPLYDAIRNEPMAAGEFSHVSAFTANIHPYHRGFFRSMPTGTNVASANDRWSWITQPDGMWDKWVRIPADERAYLVNVPMDKLIDQKWRPPKYPSFVPPGGP